MTPRHEHRWWSWRCWLLGHDLGRSPSDVRWLRDARGWPLGFFCRRNCGALLGLGSEVWIGVLPELVFGATLGVLAWRLLGYMTPWTCVLGAAAAVSFRTWRGRA